MVFDPRFLGAVTVLALAACAATGDVGRAGPGAAPAASGPGPLEKVGVLAPSDYAALSIWPERFAGSPPVLEVLPHGSNVAEGDVVAKLDARGIDEEIHQARLEAQSAAVRQRGVADKNALDEQAARSALDVARAALDRARRSLEGWKTHELAFARRQDDIAKRYEQANVDDQVDELDQLEKMYKADALVDATEEIVVKRARRQLDVTRTSNSLSRDRSQYHEAYDLALETEQREEAVRTQAEALERLAKQTEIDARARQDAELRSADSAREQNEKLAELERDRERLVLRAPRAGVLLHGAAKDYHPGRNPARWERGNQLALRQDLFLVAAPAPSAVALELGDVDLPRAIAAGNLAVEVLGARPMTGPGALRVETHPRSSSATEATYEARFVLERPLEGAVYGARAKLAFPAQAKP